MQARYLPRTAKRSSAPVPRRRRLHALQHPNRCARRC